MRRATAVIAAIVLAGIASASAPTVNAERAQKASFIVAECAWEGNPLSVDRFEFPNLDRVLIRGANNVYDEYLLENNVWRQIGVNSTMANVNATFPDFVGTFWGTFDYTDDGSIGNFTGRWAFGNTDQGRAVGRSDDGRLLKVTLGLDPAGYPAPPTDACGIAEFMVIDPN